LSLERVGRSIGDRLDALGLAGDLPPFARQIGRSDIVTRRTRPVSQDADPYSPTRLQTWPLLSIVVPVYNVPRIYLDECVASVRRQTYPFWELCICNDASSAPDTLAALDALRGTSPQIRIVDAPVNLGIAGATNRAIEIASGEFIVFLDNDDTLVETALEEVVAAVGARPDVEVIYSDEDKIDAAGTRIDHFFKPDWSPEYLESVMYVLHLLVVRKRLVLALGGLRPEFDGAQDYDLMLCCSRATDRIHHIPKVLYHWRAIPGSAAAVATAKPAALDAGLRALTDHARQKYGPEATVEPGLFPGLFRMRRGLAFKPRVSLLILTGNGRIELPGRGEVTMVDNLVDSIRARTSYTDYEIVVVDNGTLSHAQAERFRSVGVRVEDFPNKGRFNYAAKANFAVRHSRTENIVLMNDDMEVISEEWLTALVEFSQDPKIGAVGARLRHLDGTLQHVGMVVGVCGAAAHVYHTYPPDYIGYNACTHLIRNYSAVTGACLATRKSVVAQVGGFDEEFLIDYNDVDFCLRLIEAGYRVVYTPYAELYHFEGASVKRASQNPAEVEQFRRRWSRYLERDPYYNINLTRDGLDFAERSASTS
jgi:GT2 family glycosyltransferase